MVNSMTKTTYTNSNLLTLTIPTLLAVRCIRQSMQQLTTHQASTDVPSLRHSTKSILMCSSLTTSLLMAMVLTTLGHRATQRSIRLSKRASMTATDAVSKYCATAKNGTVSTKATQCQSATIGTQSNSAMKTTIELSKETSHFIVRKMI